MFPAGAGMNPYHCTSAEDIDGDDTAIIPADCDLGPPVNIDSLILDDEFGEIFLDCKTEKGIFIFEDCFKGSFDA